MNILHSLYDEVIWQEFITYKTEHQHLSKAEEQEWMSYIENRTYLSLLDDIAKPGFLPPLPLKREINKNGSTKKRVIYSYPEDFNRLLKMIAFRLYAFDAEFAPNCYAFRRGTGVKDAVRRLKTITSNNSAALSSACNLPDKYCLKVDISNYFNSIDVELLLGKLIFLKQADPSLYGLFKKMLTADAAILDKKRLTADAIIHEKRGAMAGTPISPFLANVYLKDVDWYFHNQKILYFRYSDDILIFADTFEELSEYQNILYEEIEKAHLSLNPDKVKICRPGESFEFLGLQFDHSEIDISENTRKKMKARIRRKADALRRWARKKHLSGEKAAIGFIKAMNHKFYDNGNDKDFSWSRWFFPNLTTVKSLSEIDAYMQEYIRYCVTGRHYKGNYRITYEQMKKWGYRNLVHEYYQQKQL